jgi:hypothetical protein
MKKGWETKNLGEVCLVDKCQGVHKGLPYVGLEHIESHTGRFIGSTQPTVQPRADGEDAKPGDRGRAAVV